MFTGLVETTGRLVSSTPIAGGARYVISIPFASELSLGDSVAVNGCCLTVDELDVDAKTAGFDLLAQTLRVTSLGHLSTGSPCNLERAVLPTSRMGGHFVSGHIDCTGKITHVEQEGQDHVLRIQVPHLRYCIDKGSISVDGVSLTIANILRENSELEFWLTPHTWQLTVMPSYSVGSVVNIEWDLLAKYIENFAIHPRQEG